MPSHSPAPSSSTQSAPEQRLAIERLLDPSDAGEAGSDVIRGLSQAPKSLPSRYLYDDRGSQLFEQICELPEYYLTRTEAQILRDCAPELARITGPCELVELGSGSATKTRILLDAYRARGAPLRYVPIDVSAGILEASAHQLLADYPELQVRGLVATYEQALARMGPSPLPARLVSFLGSSLGNFDRAQSDAFFALMAQSLAPGDCLLLGLDLQKDAATLEAAYDDSQGITAAFNYNLLHHLNWRFDGDFDPNLFRHWTFYNTERGQVETYLRCLQAHSVRLERLGLTVPFERGETINTEISRKFDLDRIRPEVQRQGLPPIAVWTDPQQWFALVLCRREAA